MGGDKFYGGFKMISMNNDMEDIKHLNTDRASNFSNDRMMNVSNFSKVNKKIGKQLNKDIDMISTDIVKEIVLKNKGDSRVQKTQLS